MTVRKIELRKLDPGEESIGLHNIAALDANGKVLARYECPCEGCQLWRAARPMMEAAILDMESHLGIGRE